MALAWCCVRIRRQHSRSVIVIEWFARVHRVEAACLWLRTSVPRLLKHDRRVCIASSSEKLGNPEPDRQEEGVATAAMACELLPVGIVGLRDVADDH